MLFKQVVALLGQRLVQGAQVRADVGLDAHLVGEVFEFESELEVLLSSFDIELDLLDLFLLLGRFQGLYLFVKIFAGLAILLQRLFHVVYLPGESRILFFVLFERVLQFFGFLLRPYVLVAELRDLLVQLFCLGDVVSRQLRHLPLVRLLQLAYLLLVRLQLCVVLSIYIFLLVFKFFDLTIQFCGLEL